jgi:hypothetical protein
MVEQKMSDTAYRHKGAALLSFFLMGNGFANGFNAIYTAIDFFAAAFPVSTTPCSSETLL